MSLARHAWLWDLSPTALSPTALGVLVLLVSLAPTAWAGGVEYPLLGNFQNEEGTLEIWFTPMTEPHPPQKEGEYQSIFALFQIKASEYAVNAGWHGKSGQYRLHASMSAKSGGNALLPVAASSKLQQGRRHHMALTWKGQSMNMIIDGGKASGREQAQPFTGPLVDGVIRIGSERDSKVIVHAVRISNVARLAEDLQGAQPTADLHTLLLDVFDTAPDQSGTHAKVTSGLAGETGGKIVGVAQFVTEPAPGLALWRQPKDAEAKTK